MPSVVFLMTARQYVFYATPSRKGVSNTKASGDLAEEYVECYLNDDDEGSCEVKFKRRTGGFIQNVNQNFQSLLYVEAEKTVYLPRGGCQAMLVG